MTENLKTRFQFHSPVIQAQTVRTLVAAVLKEKGQLGQITQSSTQAPALEALWEQSCSDSAPVSSMCCDALVLLVAQGHAALQYVLNNALNLLPSARNVQGLLKVTGRLMQMQVEQRDSKTGFRCPYSIRTNPHPYITALENRVDCWPTLLLEIDNFIQQVYDRVDPAYVDMLEPFLRFLYCDPQRRPQHAVFRLNLLGVLLRVRPGADGPQQKGEARPMSDRLLGCLCRLVPHMQVESVEELLELSGFVQALVDVLVRTSGGHWRAERVQLAVQLLCVCQRCLALNADCRPLLRSIRQLLPACRQDLLEAELLMGVAVLLLEAPAAQQTDLLHLALTLVPEQADLVPWLSPVLVLPLVQLLTCAGLTEALVDRETLNLNQGLTDSLLRRISGPTSPRPQADPVLVLPLTSWYSELSAALSTLHKVSDDPAAACDWLLSVSSALSSSQRLSSFMALIVSHVVLTGREDVCRLALTTIQSIAAADPCQVPSLLLVLVFKLGKEQNPVLARALIGCLPNLATHKLCVPVVLQTLHLLSSAPELRPVVMRLMTTFWKKQVRVYPDLQRLLSQPDGSVAVATERRWEQILARAACIRDICRERPYQHAGDMLAVITQTLDQCSGPELQTPAALVLQGLRELCRAEVVDIVSTWRTLGPHLSRDSRPLVIKAVAELLSLVPELTVQSEQYQKLKEEVVSFLWDYTKSKDPDVSSCGFRALAHFPEEVHTTAVLPEGAQPPSKVPENEEEEDKDKDLSIPGSSYVKLMVLTPVSVLPALELFLASLVKQEMSQMPRGVYFSALRGVTLRSDQGKTMAGIPAFMLKTYEKNNQPGLKPGLAAGLLLCYDLPLQTDRSGRPMERFLVSRSHGFQRTLTSLIHEVNIHPSEWHQALFLPQAWRGFMSRAFHAVLQGRRAELEMQQKRGQEDPEELQYKQHCAWMWTRDQLTDVIKSATKDSPVVQGNSVLALSGLTAIVVKYESNLPGDNDGGLGAGPEFVPTSTWVSIVVNTLLSIISNSYKTRGQVFSWFLHRSYSSENTASAIARSCASLALSLLVPVLVVGQQDSLSQVVSVLRDGLPDSPKADDSQAVQFHSGLALGMVVSSLHLQRLSDVSAQKDADLLSSSLEALESCSFNPNLEYNTGCTLGLGLVLSSLCHSQQAVQQNHATRTLDRLLSTLQDDNGHGRMVQEVLSYAVACVGVSAFSGGLIDATKADDMMKTLRTLTEESQQSPGLSLSLGLLVHGLASCGHGKAEDIQPRLLAAWIKILLAEGCPTMQRLAAANGLVALVGSETYLIQLKTDLEPSSQQQNRLNEVVRSVTEIITFSGAIGLQSNGACLVSHLYLSHMSTRLIHTAVPPDFSYLSERSIIRSVVDFLIDAGKKGPDCVPGALVQTALAALASVGPGVQYPPVNWTSVLSPLMRLGFGEDVQHRCLNLAASQCQSSQNASLFLGSWLSPPLVHSLDCRTRAHLYQTLGLWMKHVPEDKLQVHVETLGLQQFQDDLRPQRLALCHSLLEGLAQAMSLPNPPKTCWSILCSTTEKVFRALPSQIQDDEVDLYVGIAKCLSEMSDTEIERIVGVTEADMEKVAFVLAYLTSQGRVPLLSLNDVIAGVLRGWPSLRVGWILLQMFYQCRLAPGTNTGVSKRMEWLLELMGHIRNVAYGATPVQSRDAKPATDFLFQVFAAAVVSWGGHSIPLLLGVRAQWLPWRPGSRPAALQHSLYGQEALTDGALPRCMLGLPHSLELLLSREPWRGQVQKFIDWLFCITEAPDQSLSSVVIETAKASLMSLNASEEFKKKSVWTRTHGW